MTEQTEDPIEALAQDPIEALAKDYATGAKARERALEAVRSIERGRDEYGAAADVGWSLDELRAQLASMGVPFPERRAPLTIRNKYSKKSAG